MFDPYKPTITLHTLTLISKSGAAPDCVYMSGTFSLTENIKFGHLMGVQYLKGLFLNYQNQVLIAVWIFLGSLEIFIVRQARIQLVAKIQAAVCRVR